MRCVAGSTYCACRGMRIELIPCECGVFHRRSLDNRVYADDDDAGIASRILFAPVTARTLGSRTWIRSPTTRSTACRPCSKCRHRSRPRCTACNDVACRACRTPAILMRRAIPVPIRLASPCRSPRWFPSLGLNRHGESNPAPEQAAPRSWRTQLRVLLEATSIIHVKRS